MKLHEIPRISSSTIISSIFSRQILRPTVIFQKGSNRVQDISKHVNPSKIGSRKFSRIQYFLLIYIKESNKNIYDLSTTSNAIGYKLNSVKVAFGSNNTASTVNLTRFYGYLFKQYMDCSWGLKK